MKTNYKELYLKGFLPGPYESEEKFLQRVEKTKEVLKKPKEFITDKIFQNTDFEAFNGSALLVQKKNLFYHAASTMIVELKNGLILPIITKPKSLFIPKEEVLKHELVHARRALFDDPKFEELLAFRTSKSKYRRTLSPIFSSNIEVLLFFLTTILSFWTLLPMLINLTFFSYRLFYRHKIIRHCKDFLKRCTKHPEPVLRAMTDQEILAMSKGEIGKIDFSLFRWKFLEEIFIIKI